MVVCVWKCDINWCCCKCSKKCIPICFTTICLVVSTLVKTMFFNQPTIQIFKTHVKINSLVSYCSYPILLVKMIVKMIGVVYLYCRLPYHRLIPCSTPGTKLDAALAGAPPSTSTGTWWSCSRVTMARPGRAPCHIRRANVGYT